MSKSKNGGWRYQVVYIEHGNGDNEGIVEFSICEVYLDKDGKLEMWSNGI